jgi:acyl-CoA thioester hydrolase
MNEAIQGYPVVVRVPVAWADMDYFRHVNNTVFFRWFETARIAYLERIRFADDAAQAGIGPILSTTQARFRRPVFYPDTMVVAARSSAIADDRFTMEYLAVSEAQDAVVAEGGAVVVSYDYGVRRKAPLPAAVRSAIDALEG